MRKVRAFFKKTACFGLCAALFLCLFLGLAPVSLADEVKITAVTAGETVEITEGAVFDNVLFYNANEISVSVNNVTFKNCRFYGENGVSISGAENVSFIGCDFFGQKTAVLAENASCISFEGCYFTECGSAIAAKNTDFSYLSSGGKSGYIKNCYFYSNGNALFAENSGELSFVGGQLYGSETGMLLKGVTDLSVTDTVIFGSDTALSMADVKGKISGVLFYQNGFNVKSEAKNAVKIEFSASVETPLLYPDDISYGVTQKDCSFISAADYKSRFTFNKEGELEGFTDTAGVRVEVTRGALFFEPDNNYIFINRNSLFLNNLLFCKCEVLFSEKAELYGEVNLKTVNNAPWINGGTNKITLESEDGLRFTSSLFGLLSPLKHAEWKLSLEGRFAVDYIAFLPDISVKAELVSEKVIRVSLSGYSAPVFSDSPEITVGGTRVPFEVFPAGGTEAYLVFEKDISRAARNMTVTVKGESLSEPFASLLSGGDVLGRSPEKEAEDFSLDSVEIYKEYKLDSRVSVPKKDIFPILLNAGVAVLAVSALAVLGYFLITFLSKRNQIRKFAKKGRRALKNRRRSNRF